MEWLEKNTNKFFKMHFDGTKAEDNLKPLFEDLIADAKRIEISCDSSDVSRKRRAFSADDEDENDDGDATADEGDPMDADTSAAKGTRKITRTDRLRFYVHYAYCKQVDSSADFCDYFYDKFNAEHPRDHGKPERKYPRPERPQN